MNTKAKGNRSERRARDILKSQGYDLIIKSGGSFTAWDLVALSCEFNHAKLLQIKSNKMPSKSELDRLRAFLVPEFCRKELWIFYDYCKSPSIIEL